MSSVFSHLILDVQDLDRSLAFYRDMLELPVVRLDDWEGHRLAYLSTGRTEILLMQQPKSEQNPLLDRSGGLVINFHVGNLNGVAKSLENKDVRVLRGLDKAAWGEMTLLVADPDGYAVLLSEPSELEPSAETLH
jgi:catechol 2,3-dioxygenase-like lactoylglutathione lyase family enzyme